MCVLYPLHGACVKPLLKFYRALERFPFLDVLHDTFVMPTHDALRAIPEPLVTIDRDLVATMLP